MKIKFTREDMVLALIGKAGLTDYVGAITTEPNGDLSIEIKDGLGKTVADFAPIIAEAESVLGMKATMEE